MMDEVQALIEKIEFEAVNSEIDRALASRIIVTLRTLTADNVQFREALNQSRLAFAGYVSAQSAIDLIDRAALNTGKEPTNEPT